MALGTVPRTLTPEALGGEWLQGGESVVSAPPAWRCSKSSPTDKVGGRRAEVLSSRAPGTRVAASEKQGGGSKCERPPGG